MASINVVDLHPTDSEEKSIEDCNLEEMKSVTGGCDTDTWSKIGYSVGKAITFVGNFLGNLFG